MAVVKVDTWCEAAFCKRCDDFQALADMVPSYVAFCRQCGDYLGEKARVVHGGDAIVTTRHDGNVRVSWKRT